MDDNMTVSWENSQAAQKQIEYKNVNQDGQKQQSHQNTYTCTAESLHAAQRKGEKYEWKREKATGLQEKRKEGTIHKQTEKLYKKSSQQRNKKEAKILLV